MRIGHKKFNLFSLWTYKATRFTSYAILVVMAALLLDVMNESAGIVWVIDFLKGAGGLFTVVLSIIIGIYGAVINSSTAVMIAVGIGVGGIFGPAILTSIFSVPI